jgi:cbb3-type cytochrome oxidase cytochrome c subunit
MKGLVPLFLGIFGTFAFSWAGLTLIPNYQIGHLDPQSDEEGTDIYPVPKSGMADRGRKIYAANGCVYCHSQQLRADYAAPDLERTRDLDQKQKWGERRSAPRDYIFERPVLLGKMRLGPDLANIGKSAPSEGETAAPPAISSPAASASPAASPPANSPAPTTGSSPAAPPPSTAAAPPATSPAASPAKAVAANSPAAAPTSATTSSVPPAPANPAANAASTADTAVGPNGGPPAYSAAWHHLHLYSPRGVALDSNMPAYHFLYEKRRVSGERSADALKLSGSNAPSDEWEIVPTYDAKCLVAYLMSLDQSHELKEAKLTSVPASSPAPAKEEKK